MRKLKKNFKIHGKGRMKGGQTEGEMKHERLWTLRNKLRASEERGVGEWDRLVMDSKEGMYCMVHWVLYAANESSNFTSENRDVLCGD